MRVRSSLAALCFAVQALAQSPVVGPAEFFQPGHYYLRDNYDPPLPLMEAMIAADGEGYAIDLTPLNDGVLYGTDSVVCTVAPEAYAHESAYFDTANVMITVHDVATTQFSQYVFLSGPDRVQYVGGQPNGAGGTGNDLVLQRYVDEDFAIVLEAGMAYAYASSETVDAVWTDLSGSDLHTVTGTVENRIDGYGSVTLPDGQVLEQTLRLRSVMDYTDENDLFGTTEHHDTLYTWYAAGYGGPLMTLAHGFYALTSGYVSPLPFTLYRPQAIGTGIATNASAERTRIFPNPAHGQVTISGLDGTAPARFMLTDASGRRMIDASVTSRERHLLPLPRLSAGVYVLDIENGDRRERHRLLVRQEP